MHPDLDLLRRVRVAERREAWAFVFGFAAFVTALVFCSWAADATEQRDRAFGDAYRQCSADREASK